MSNYFFGFTCKDKENEMPQTYVSRAHFYIHVIDSLSGNKVADANYYLSAKGYLKYLKPVNKTDNNGNFEFVLEVVDNFHQNLKGYFGDFYIVVFKDSLVGKYSYPSFYNDPKQGGKYSKTIKLSKPSIFKLRVRDAINVKQTKIDFRDSLLSGNRILTINKVSNAVLDTTMFFSTYRNIRIPSTVNWFDSTNRQISYGSNGFINLKITNEDTSYAEIIF